MIMSIDELLDLPLREILNNFVVVYSPECAYYYGIFRDEDVEKIYQEYNIDDDYPEAFGVENLIVDELLCEDQVKGYDSLLRIMDNLGISKKMEDSNGEV